MKTKLIQSLNSRYMRIAYIAVIASILLVASIATVGPSLASDDDDRRGRDDRDFDLMLAAVPLRDGVSADIHLKVFVNEKHRCNANTIVAIHGMANTAATWEPLTEALFVDNPMGRKVCRVIVVDLPGHGESGLPDNLIYSDVTLDDQVRVLVEVLDRLAAMNLHADMLMGHSQGGLIIQLAQQELKNEGTNLRDRFGIKHAVLLAPVPAAPVPWFIADSGLALQLFIDLGLIVLDPVQGLVIYIPDTIWGPFFCSNLQGIPAPGTPSATEVAEKGYNSPESISAASQMIGAPPFNRIQVDAGIFDEDSGTHLYIVTYEQDQFIRPEEEAALYMWLTGDETGEGLAVVSGEFTVHNMHICEPESLLNSIAGVGDDDDE